MNFATRILVLIGAVAFALGGSDALAQAKDSPTPTAAPTKDAPTKDAAIDAPTTDAATKDAAIDAPTKDAAIQDAPTKDTAPTKDAGADKDAKSDAPDKSDATKPDATKPDATTPEKPVVDKPEVVAKPALFRILPTAPRASAAKPVLGSVDPETDDLEVTLNPLGAGVYQVRFSRYKQTVKGDDHYQIVGPTTKTDGTVVPPFEPPMTAWAVVINDFNLNLFDKVWTVEKPGVFSLQVVDTAGQPALNITRTYTLDGYELKCDTAFENLSAKPLKVVWRQNAIGDVPRESDYRGDAREVMVGYHDLDYDPKGVHVHTSEGSFTRQSMLDDYEERIKKGRASDLVWPGDQTVVRQAEIDSILSAPPFWPHEDLPSKHEMVWLASLNRYFASIVYRPSVDLTEENEDATVALALDSIFQSAVGISKTGKQAARNNDERLMAFTLTSKPININPGKTFTITLAMFNGPRQSDVLDAKAQYRVLELEEDLVKYELGCTWCLFQGVADFLLGFLKLLHVVVSDWGISIIILVICVRILLHPLTKKAQVSMSVMGKQMAAIQPEMQKIKEKYKNDSQKQQQEMMKLYREKGINPLGFLGCLPMFLQMPIWMALYAMLWGAIELRHQPAFFGVFQSINSDWAFLSDLSTYDTFINFNSPGFDLPLCGMHIPGAFNILPILMAIMFYLQQKLMSPEATTDQQKQQQKMMKFMVFIFPIMLYAAPSGLTLYILASSTAGMIDSYYVRKHIKQMEADGTLFKKKERKPGGFMDRLGSMVEEKQKQIQARDQALQGSKGGGAGRRGGGKPKKRK